jgi:ABC-2 type transport system ATP-binding protein
MITVKNLIKVYPSFALRIDGLELAENNTYALVGANGAGKTTFLSCLTNQIDFAGDIYYDTLPLKENREDILRRIGYVGDRLYFYRDASVTEYYSFVKSFCPTWDDRIFSELLVKLQADIYLDMKIKHLSKGNALKAALIACLSHRPKYLLLDEPTAGLDIAMRQEFYGIVNDYRADGTIAVFSTHMAEDIECMATHISLLNAGHLALNGAISALVDNADASGIRNLVLEYL